MTKMLNGCFFNYKHSTLSDFAKVLYTVCIRSYIWFINRGNVTSVRLGFRPQPQILQFETNKTTNWEQTLVIAFFDHHRFISFQEN